MHDGGSVAGHLLTGRTRVSEVGTWHDAESPGGEPSGLLRFNDHLLAAPGARERLVAAISADRRLAQSGQYGLLPISDLVAAHGEVWLITGRRAVPTVADLLTGATQPGWGPDAGSAATILIETAQTLLGLHAAGLTHGAVHPGTVVIGEDGSALLAERGLLEALRGDPASPERDIAAWQSLARTLSASWATGQQAQLLDHAASVASSHGLAAARDTLTNGRDMLPAGFSSRESLVRTLHAWSALPPVAAALPPARLPQTGELQTLLDPSRHMGAGPGGPPQAEAGGMRFGPGVPADTTAAQIWRSGATQHPDQVAKGRRKPKPKRRTAWFSSLLICLLLAAFILYLRMAPPAEMAVSKVSVSAPKKTQGCDAKTRIMAVVTTNGEAGTFKFEWDQSDGKKTEGSQKVDKGTTSVDLPLIWQVSGPGRFKGTATLRVLDHTPEGKPISAKASFSYKC
ncbi:protein kinase family protein [Herbidospora sp. RD11066]